MSLCKLCQPNKKAIVLDEPLGEQLGLTGRFTLHLIKEIIVGFGFFHAIK